MQSANEITNFIIMGMKPSILTAMSLAVCLVSVVASCGVSQKARNDEQTAESVRKVLETQQAAWNRGNIDEFMDGYDRADTTTFVSGAELTRGWKTVLERYKQHYKSQGDMGTLAFSELSVAPISSDLAVADGRWQLTRDNDKPHGRFTLLFQRKNGNWRIIHDTTTSAAP